jgi:predicted RNase H-like nuclease (RuvC/YqgF family)
MEVHNLTSGEWVVWCVLTLITLVINGTVTGLVLRRFWEKRDLKRKISDERDSKAIDADIRATEMFVGRIEKLEAAHEKLQAEQLSQMEIKARIEADYRHLEKENERLNKEVDELRRKAHQLSTDIMHRDAEIVKLSTALQSLTERFNRANPAKT